jgi:anaerobic selenocysteine-containing dehydrogenase
MNHLGRALTTLDSPPIKVLFVYNCNPVATLPDQNHVVRGLEREDLFTVVFDQVRTDTVAYADLVLPATTFLETYDVAKAYGPPSLQLVTPVIDAVGEARPNVEVFGELARRLDVGAVESEAEALLRLLGRMPASFREELGATGRATPPCGATPIQFVDVRPRTPDGKVDLYPEPLASQTPTGLYRFQEDPVTASHPLALISPASDKTISSTLGELVTGPARLLIHPADAAARGIEDGDTVRIFNDLGEVHCLAAVAVDVRPGTVSLPKGLWRAHTLNGSTANALVPDSLTDLGGGACFNDARVEVQRMVAARYESADIAFWVAK